MSMIHVRFRKPSRIEPSFDSDGKLTDPGARDVAESLAAALEPLVERVSDVEQHSFYGWSFETAFHGRRFFHVLNQADEMHLSITMEWGFLHRLLGRRPGKTMTAYRETVASALGRMDGLSEVRWYTTDRSLA